MELTISIGISTYKPEKLIEPYTNFERKKGIEIIIKEADNALLKAKEKGKNRTCLGKEIKVK